MILVIIQARMGSTRLPGKVLKMVEGIPLLKYQIERVKKAKLPDKIVVATTTSLRDDPIEAFCQDNQIDCFRGHEQDVLSRYYECARHYKGEIIVRLTADCPFSDPRLIDATVDLFINSRADYAANTVPPESCNFPDGTDVEVMSWPALQRAHREVIDPHDREHVTFYFWKQDNGFKTVQLKHDQDLSKYRFTVDYPEDYEVAAFIIQELLRTKKNGSMEEVIEILDRYPEIRKKNSQYYFGVGWKQGKHENS